MNFNITNKKFSLYNFQPARHTKLEKADILEMTVKHLQTIQRSQLAMAVQTDPNVLHKFKSGFADCTDEVSRYISQIDGVETGVKQRLIGHLNTCIGGLQQISSPYNNNYANAYRNAASLSFGNSAISTLHQQQQQQPPANINNNVMPLPQDVNNNGRIQMNGVQLIPSRLPTGELALVMPNSSNLSYFPPATFPPHSTPLDLNSTFPRLSAFNSVSKSVGHQQPQQQLQNHKQQQQHIPTHSPPPSPVSSISSGDDSMPATEYQSQTITPPLQQQQNIANLYPTPPSGGSIKLSMKSITVQQPQITSTTESAKLKPLSVITNTNGNNNTANNNNVGKRGGDCQNVMTKKRSYDQMDDGLLIRASNEPTEKIYKLDMEPMRNQSDRSEEQNQTNGDMWRPW